MAQAAPTFQQKAEYFGLAAAVRLIGLLPFRALRHLGNVVGAVAYAVDGRGRQVALANLESAFGDTLTAARRREIARGSYQTFARTMIELFWSPRLNERVIREIADIEGLDCDPCHSDPKQAVIYLCLHFSNFEWLGHFGAYLIETAPVVAQRFKNPLIGQIFDRLRASTGNHVIPQERAMIRMLKHLKEGGKFAMLGDLNLDPGEASVIIENFGGLKICATQMHAALALRTGAKIVPVECRPKPDGRYRMIFHRPLEYPPEATAAQIAQQCWEVLEPSIHEQPECWLWLYKHWRFKPADDRSGRYPFYANVAKRFDKMLRKSGGPEA